MLIFWCRKSSCFTSGHWRSKLISQPEFPVGCMQGLPAPRLVGRKAAKPTILNLVPQILDVT